MKLSRKQNGYYYSTNKEALLKAIGVEYCKGTKLKEIAEMFGMTEKQISYVIHRKLCLRRNGVMKKKEKEKPKGIIYDGELDKEENTDFIVIDNKVYRRATVSDLVKRYNSTINKKVENN
jgi:hypothetical protein